MKDKASCSKTNQLYFQYLEMFDILMRNLFSERLGNWEEYLRSLEQMLPTLAATGRRCYTKSVYWFLKEMENLDDYTVSVFKKGGFVVRRTDRPDGGISPDLAIEQVLMASLKGNTGLTRGKPVLNQESLYQDKELQISVHNLYRKFYLVSAPKVATLINAVVRNMAWNARQFVTAKIVKISNQKILAHNLMMVKKVKMTLMMLTDTDNGKKTAIYF